MIELKHILFSIGVILFLGSSQSESIAQSYCQQQYKLLFRDNETETIWIGLNLYGDQCEYSKAIQIKTKGASVEVMEKDMESFDYWDELTPINEEQPIKLNSTNRAWEYAIIQLKIKSPSYNAKLMNYYLEDLNSICGKGWNNAMGVNGMNLPKMSAQQTPRLIYFDPTGLYFNYDIIDAYYFPDSKHLIIFTFQKEKCGGGGSMHGFLVFKLN